MKYKAPFWMTAEALEVMRQVDEKIQKAPMKFNVHISPEKFDILLRAIPYSLRNRFYDRMQVENSYTGLGYSLLP
jgi:hypothetical protein